MRAVDVELTDADRARLRAWVGSVRAGSGTLPDGVEPVQVRLVRAVGRGRLPDAGPAYLKVMGFPRVRDRVRYSVRPLPAVHEARMLAHVRDAGIPCPRVVCVSGVRAFGVPRVSLLVTLALDAAGEVDFERAASTAARLAECGIYHPDLKRDNFVACSGGDTAVLDLQSARRVRRGVSSAARERMAVKLVSEFDALDQVSRLVDLGLIESADRAEDGVMALRAADAARRIARCLTNSTEFVVEHRLGGRVHRRRRVSLEDASNWRPHADSVRLWIGDRALEVLDGCTPRLAALYRKWWWLPGENSVYIPRDGDRASLSPADTARLLDGFVRSRGECGPGADG